MRTKPSIGNLNIGFTFINWIINLNIIFYKYLYILRLAKIMAVKSGREIKLSNGSGNSA